MSSPDSDTYDGSLGESRDRQLFVANEQTTIAQAIDAVSSIITLAAARFADGDVIITDSEEMRVLSGGGTNVLNVQRAIYSTQPAAHSQGSVVYAACNYSDLTVQPVDTTGTDESSWCKLALTQSGLDTAVSGKALVLGDRTCRSTISFWRRITVPADTSAQKKTDIKLRLTGTMSLA